MRIITVIIGGLLVLSSVWCFAHPGATFLSLAFILGIVMLLQGTASIMNYVLTKKEKRTGWILAEGILTFILAIMVLSNQLVTDAIVPVFFGMWIMYSGTIRIAAALAVRSAGGRAWIWTLAMGVISVLAGVYSFFNPVLAGLALVMLVGVFFLIQGVNILSLGILMPRKKIKKEDAAEEAEQAEEN